MHRVAAALACVSVLALIAASGERARADEPYPSKPIRFVLPQPAGGAVDLIARALGDRLSYAMRQRARDQVDRATRRLGKDEADGLGWIGLVGGRVLARRRDQREQSKARQRSRDPMHWRDTS